MQQMAQDETPVMTGSAPRWNGTPLEPAFSCLSHQIAATQRPVLAIAVGDIKDYTGKYSQGDGNMLTQGGALMVYSALGKLGGAIELRERFDTRIAELELAYTDRRQLGDGRAHSLRDDKGGADKNVPWVPYYGGTILKSNYYIVGGITELNYNIQSGGAELLVNGIGPKARTFTMGVGVDLRMVDTETLRIVGTTSLQKQITGHEVGVNVFRFFGSDLFDLNAGFKNLEPLQLGVRTTLEQGVLDLVARVTGTDARGCAAQPALAAAKASPAAAAATAPVAPLAPAGASPGSSPQAAASLNAPAAAAPAASAAATAKPSDAAQGAAEFDVVHEAESAQMSQSSAASLDALVARVRAGVSAKVAIVGRDSESGAPDKRRQLTEARIQNLRSQLAQRGINPAQVRLAWQASDGDMTIYRRGPGFQVLAWLQVSP
jgi:curli biogenesis system outer membrane secretion channel CsgG